MSSMGCVDGKNTSPREGARNALVKWILRNLPRGWFEADLASQ